MKRHTAVAEGIHWLLSSAKGSHWKVRVVWMREPDLSVPVASFTGVEAWRTRCEWRHMELVAAVYVQMIRRKSTVDV
jgi:hypothetical protein